MKTFYTLITALLFGMVVPVTTNAQNEWPKTITGSDGSLIKVYQWQPESFANGTLEANAAISVAKNGKAEPSFGMIWLTASTNNNGQQVMIGSVDVNAIRLPDETDENELAALQTSIANAMSNQNFSIPASDINNALQTNKEQEKLSGNLNNNPPKIIYSDKPSLLVVIDGAPKLQQNSKWGVETVVNTPFIIVKNNNNKFYLYGGKHWYAAPSATGPYAMTTSVPANLEKIQSEITQANTDNKVQQEENDYTISNIIVSTEPAELLQSNGEPNFTPVQQTNLLYVKNSNNDIFMDVSSQQYYVLLSGRWYKSQKLSGKWNYVASDKLPPDFARIPEGSPKDNVLASVAGTLAAKDAVMNAQVPQTAKVDRKNANADIQYDGSPQFDDIDGTDMAYAVNTPDYVIRWRGTYYAVDNGVWFQSYSANGPWVVSADRPYAVSLIPPRYPVYAMKYVYIYDVTPDYIYMGYTPGYLNTFVYGPTVVYGTGYYYRPWYGSYYYARPYTWGFNMHYNPWTGWGFGFNYNMGWFHMSAGNYSPWGWGGWWGPSIYRPSYCWTPYYGGYRHGYYGNSYYRSRNTVIVNNINVYHNNNIYNHRRDVVTRDTRRAVSYNRNGQSAPVRRFNNARPSERNVSRDANTSSRPSVIRDNNAGSASPRNPSGRISGRAADNNRAATRPSRTFTERPAAGTNDRVNTQRPSARTNAANNNVNRQLAERRDNTSTSPSSSVNRQRTIRSQTQQQPAVRSSQRRAPNTISERSQPVRRNVSPAPRSSAPQRVERSFNNSSSPRSEGNRSSRSSGNSESRARRG